MNFDLQALPEPTTSGAGPSEALAALLESFLQPPHALRRYTSTWNLVMEEGCVFHESFPGKLAGNWPAGRCYENARRLVRTARRADVKLLYVEGYALSGGALYEHGWTTTPEGVVLDPTWGTVPPVGYAGVPLADREVRRALAHTDSTTVVFGDLMRSRDIHRNGFARGALIRDDYRPLARRAPAPVWPDPAVPTDDPLEDDLAERLNWLRNPAGR